MKKFFNIVFSRLLYTILFIIIQGLFLFLVIGFFKEQFVYFYTAFTLLSIFGVLDVINRDINPAYKVAWLIPILLLPIFGALMYIIYGKAKLSSSDLGKKTEVDKGYREALDSLEDSLETLKIENPEAALHSNYIKTVAGIPPYQNTSTKYLSIGEEYFEVMKEQLRKAEKFIFFEYFIVEEGKMWNEILEILKLKASEGVDVRVMYDDIGCFFTLPKSYDATLEKMGIKTCVFHKFNSILDSKFNTRDHRKICVIDGNIGITGGINIADEYINAYVKHGHWKDAGILIEGKAVWGLTVMFLSLWNYFRNENDNFSNFMPTPEFYESIESDGYVQPYSDTPYDDEPVGENVYLNIINRAKKYVYITTPYLIIDNEMITAMRIASRSGVDIKIITPGIPDKKFVYTVTRSYYGLLIDAGVKIYEYTPGFIHAKNFVSDDTYGVVGTINLDYRSLYLHYECAAWLYNTKSVLEIRDDFLSTLEKCTEITNESMKKGSIVKRFVLAVIRAFAPLM